MSTENRINIAKGYEDEFIEIIDDIIDDRQFSYRIGSAFKHLAVSTIESRHDRIQDLEEANRYIQREIRAIQSDRSLPTIKAKDINAFETKP